MKPLLFAVIPTRNREELYGRCVAAIRPQVDQLITVAHLGAPYAMGDAIIRYDVPIPNICRMWNLGLDKAMELADGREHYVAILNDDAEVPPGWLATIQSAMAADGTVLGSGEFPGVPQMVCGWAFVVKGGTVRGDERWSWWASDNQVLQDANEHWGGWTRVEGLEVRHDQTPLPPGPHRRKAERDRDRWIALQRGKR